LVGIFEVENEVQLSDLLVAENTEPRFCESLSLPSGSVVKMIGNIRKNGRSYVSNAMWGDLVAELISSGDWKSIADLQQEGVA